MQYTLIIPDWTPWRLNQVRGRHWSVEHRAKQETIEMLAMYALIQKVPAAKGRRRISVCVTLAGRMKQPDRDAYDKVLLDSMKRSGLILDDSDRGLCGRIEVTFLRGPERSTTIYLEDCAV